jgi:predicted Fe-S protein YdhL (DUF1289 family)
MLASLPLPSYLGPLILADLFSKVVSQAATWCEAGVRSPRSAAMGSPCIDVCRYDEATGWCFGCGMTKPERKRWKKEKEKRGQIREALPGRLASLSARGHDIGEAARKSKKKRKA